MKEPDEADRVQLLSALGRRLGKTHLIPGMTIHQAKGREWASVGVHLVPDEAHHLATGLSQERHSDRALCVALTRAKRSVHRV
jgi:DNA helicase II / ATP-dependent DNA helicase PcrA